MKNKSAFIAIEGVPYGADILYEYGIPEELLNLVCEGSAVICPFGAGNRTVRGIVFRIDDRENAKVKNISGLACATDMLDSYSLRIAFFIRNKYFCTYFDAAKTVMPPGFLGGLDRCYSVDDDFADSSLKEYFYANKNSVERKKLIRDLGTQAYTKILRAVKAGTAFETLKSVGVVRDNVRMFAVLGENAEEYETEYSESENKNIKKHICVIRFIRERGAVETGELLTSLGITRSITDTLKKKGVITIEKREMTRNGISSTAEPDLSPLCLMPEQKKAFCDISQNLGTGGTHLLYGITGSGKTHVYMALIDLVLSRGQSALVLIPEISITLQTVGIFCKRYGSCVAVLHSGLSTVERSNEWKRIRAGECNVVIGTRSAVFAPLHNPGIIIIDEEQEHTYKSEKTPKYDAVEIARFRAYVEHSLLLVASATPSFERYRLAKEGKIGFSRITKRFNEKPLPKVIVSDMTNTLAEGNNSLFGPDLLRELQVNAEKGEQSILFMNRRGYSSFVSCPKCKFVYTCKSCGIPLTYHRTSGKLVCHYCGFSTPAPYKCPSCGSDTIRFSGAGTQKAEEELKKFFPAARVLRMDADTVTGRDMREKIIWAFRRKEYDILLGTQMITKGLDFPGVTLVGVLMADSLLYSSDFRAYEKTFSLITQVIGRAGRAEKEGRAVVQTYSPTHTVLGFAFNQDYEGFFEQESALRKLLLYPPYCDICQAVFLADTLERAFEAAEKFIKDISSAVAEDEYKDLPVSVIRPRETAVPMENGKHRVRVLVKCRDCVATRRMLARIYIGFLKNKEMKDVITDIGMNPSAIV